VNDLDYIVGRIDEELEDAKNERDDTARHAEREHLAGVIKGLKIARAFCVECMPEEQQS